MDFWKRSGEQRKRAWQYLWETLNPDVALLQEIVPPEESFKTFDILYHELEGRRKWGNAIVSRYRILREIHFTSKYPGSEGLVAGQLSLPGGDIVTVINVYGLIDENGYSTTTMHHILSDLTPLLHRGNRENIILAGDFNISEQWDIKYNERDPLHRLVFQRLENLRLTNCTKKFFKEHIQTHVHSKSMFGWQNDYVFLSDTMIKRVSDCKVIQDPVVLEFSDHYPVMIEIEDQI